MSSRSQSRRRSRLPTIEVPVYNPLDYENLAQNVADRLMVQAPESLPLQARFMGAGVYALFYAGDFEPYAAIRYPDIDHPIYVSKADLEGARKGKRQLSSDPLAPLIDDGPYLVGRISDHQKSIEAVTNLRIEDFVCRYLRVTPVWITMAERLLIRRYRPIWNGCVDGFGLHDPGKDRSPIISWWDALHPGRAVALTWKSPIQYVRTYEQAVAQAKHCIEAPPEPIFVVDGDEDSTGDDVVPSE